MKAMNKKKIILFATIILVIIVGISVFFFMNKKENKKKESNEFSSEIPNVVLKENGVPKFLGGEFVHTSVETEDDVFKALDEVKDLYGFKSADKEFEIVRKDENQDFTYYRLRQKTNGVLVFGHEIVVSIDADKKVSSFTGNYYPKLNVNTYAKLSKKEAEEKLKEKISEYTLLTSNKYIYIKEEKPVLTYIFSIISNEGVEDVVVDAKTGEIVKRIPKSSLASYQYTAEDIKGTKRTITIQENTGLIGSTYYFHDPDRNITIIDASNIGADMGSQENKKWLNVITLLLKFSTAQNAICARFVEEELVYCDYEQMIDKSQSEYVIKNAIPAMDNFAKTYDYYKNKLGRNSYDNKGSEIFVNLGISSNFGKHDQYFNAAWMGGDINKFIIGTKDGITFAYALDVVAHEFTHGVIENTAGLIYQGESGALNEGYADIMGSLIEGKNFQLGEDIEELRDMSNPNKYSDPSEKDGKYYFPTDVETYNEQWRTDTMNRLKEKGNPIEVWTDWDHGGVHTNSGVPNHAAYLMYEKGAFKDREEMAKVWYNSLFLMTPNSDFEDCALAVIQSAKNLKISSDKVKLIEEAFIETKMLADDYYSLSGKVENESTKEPIPYALVTAINKLNPNVSYEVYTNKEGEYSFDKLPATDYTITFEKGKYKGVEKEFYLKENTENFNAQLVPIPENDYSMREVVFVLDISKSMDESDAEDLRKKIMSNILASLDNNSKVALVVFAKNGTVINNGLSSKSVDKKILVTDIFNMTNDDGRNDNSGTNGAAGLEKGINLFTGSSKSRKYIIFFTDGMDNASSGKKYSELIEIANEKGIRILTMGLGSDLNEGQLMEIAEKTNGKYYHVTGANKLYKFDRRILEELE